jgi:hypothetical protein
MMWKRRSARRIGPSKIQQSRIGCHGTGDQPHVTLADVRASHRNPVLLLPLHLASYRYAETGEA